MIQQEIQDIHAAGRLLAVQFSVAALRTRNRDELLILNIEELGEVAASGLKLITFVAVIVAFGTFVDFTFHRAPPLITLIYKLLVEIGTNEIVSRFSAVLGRQ